MSTIFVALALLWRMPAMEMPDYTFLVQPRYEWCYHD